MKGLVVEGDLRGHVPGPVRLRRVRTDQDVKVDRRLATLVLEAPRPVGGVDAVVEPGGRVRVPLVGGEQGLHQRREARVPGGDQLLDAVDRLARGAPGASLTNRAENALTLRGLSRNPLEASLSLPDPDDR